VFDGEAGEDAGGPKRELWRLFEDSLRDTYFEGFPNKLIIRHNTIALQVKVHA